MSILSFVFIASGKGVVSENAELSLFHRDSTGLAGVLLRGA